MVEYPYTRQYTTPAVLHETEITGPIVAELYASSSARDTDFVARVGVVRRDGSVYKLGSKLVRARYRNGEIPEPLTPGEIVCYRIEAANISIVLMPGEAIRLDVTSSLFPDADRNMNTFGKVGYDAEGIVAHQRIYEIEKTDVLKLDPFNKFGKPSKIAQLFGGKEGYLKAVKELEAAIYTDEAV